MDTQVNQGSTPNGNANVAIAADGQSTPKSPSKRDTLRETGKQLYNKFFPNASSNNIRTGSGEPKEKYPDALVSYMRTKVANAQRKAAKLKIESENLSRIVRRKTVYKIDPEEAGKGTEVHISQDEWEDFRLKREQTRHAEYLAKQDVERLTYRFESVVAHNRKIFAQATREARSENFVLSRKKGFIERGIEILDEVDHSNHRRDVTALRRILGSGSIAGFKQATIELLRRTDADFVMKLEMSRQVTGLVVDAIRKHLQNNGGRHA